MAQRSRTFCAQIHFGKYWGAPCIQASTMKGVKAATDCQQTYCACLQTIDGSFGQLETCFERTFKAYESHTPSTNIYRLMTKCVRTTAILFGYYAVINWSFECVHILLNVYKVSTLVQWLFGEFAYVVWRIFYRFTATKQRAQWNPPFSGLEQAIAIAVTSINAMRIFRVLFTLGCGIRGRSSFGCGIWCTCRLFVCFSFT